MAIKTNELYFSFWGIVNVLSDMDKDIEALENRFAKTRQIKQGMM